MVAVKIERCARAAEDSVPRGKRGVDFPVRPAAFRCTFLYVHTRRRRGIPKYRPTERCNVTIFARVVPDASRENAPTPPAGMPAERRRGG